MGRKRHTPEQIITALREAEVAEACTGPRQIREADERELGITEHDVLPMEAGVRREPARGPSTA